MNVKWLWVSLRIFFIHAHKHYFFPEFSELSWMISRCLCVHWATLSLSEYLLSSTMFAEHPWGVTVSATVGRFYLLLGTSCLFADGPRWCTNTLKGTAFKSQNYRVASGRGSAGRESSFSLLLTAIWKDTKKEILGAQCTLLQIFLGASYFP